MSKKVSPGGEHWKSLPGSRGLMRSAAVASGAIAVSLAISASPASAQAAPVAQGTTPAKTAEPAKKAGVTKVEKKAASGTNKAADNKKTTGAGGGSTQAAAVPAAAPATGGGVASTTIQDVVVTSRLREESLQDVPVPVTAVGGEELDKKHQATVKDFAQTSPSVTVNAPNARNTSIAIRGVGKNLANDALESSVGVIVDGVFVTLPGLTWGDYADLERIELIRGPQGTLLGKNTTLGVLNIVTKGPSFTPEKELELTYGNRNLFVTKGTATGPLIDNQVAYRASVYFDHQDPLLENQVLNRDDVNGAADRWGGRVQLLFKHNDDVSTRVIAEHGQSSELNTAIIKTSDPQFYTDTNAARGTTFTSRLARFNNTPIFDPFGSVQLDQQEPTKTETNGISSQTDWRTHGGYTITSISAYKDYHFDARNDNELSSLEVQQGGYLVDSWQASQELRLTSPKNQDILGQKFDWQAGLYGLHSDVDSTNRQLFGADAGKFAAPDALYNTLVASLGSAGATQALSASLDGIFLRQAENPVTTSVAAYGQGTWHATDRADLTLGIRNTYEHKTNSTQKWYVGGANLAGYGAVAPYLIGLRQGATALFTNGTGKIDGDAISADSWSWLINPSYKLTSNVLAYASYSHGEKSGAVQFDQVTGAPANVKPEVVEDYELGIKGSFFERSLFLNANLYWTDITDYQAFLAKPPGPGSLAWSTYLGNVPGVRVRGAELEGSYRTPIEGLNVSFGASYNDGTYTSYPGAQCSTDLQLASNPCDYTGRDFSGVSRWIGNIGLDYSRQVFNGYTGYFFVGNTYRSRVNYGVTELTTQDGYSITNAGIGIRPNNESWDLSFWGKNVFDTEYYTFLAPYTSTTPTIGIAGDPLQFGVTFRSKL